MKENSELKKIEKLPKSNKSILGSILKIIVFIILLFIQVNIMCYEFDYSKGSYNILLICDFILKLFSVLWLFIRHDDDAYKISWILLIFVFGISAIIIYFLWGNSRLSKKKTDKICKIENDTKKYLYNSPEILNDFSQKNDVLETNEIKYIQNVCGFYLNYNDSVKYLKNGNIFFEELKKDLKAAKKSIFMEFYIYSKGKLLTEVVSILKEKAAEGLEVVLIIDSLGSLVTKPKNFIKDLEKSGIKAYIYNEFSINTSDYINFRNHKKIVSIDSNISYIAGVNVADEYSNIKEKYGYWKDNGIKVTGEASFAVQVMLLRDVEIITNISQDYKRYKEENIEKNIDKAQNVNHDKGFVLCFADGPHNRKNPMEEVYIQSINNSKDYIYIATPYLTMGEAIINNLMYKARTGVKVNLFVPHIPDKKFVQMIARSRYEELLEAGIQIFEFTPGFLHAKMLVSDDTKAIVGSANLDFRSLHLNFESMCYISDTGEEIKIKEDFEEMKKMSTEVKLEVWKKRGIFKRVFEKLISSFSPLV